MKKVLVVLFILLTSTLTLHAQEGSTDNESYIQELANIDLNIDANPSVFKQIATNTYVSQEPLIMIMGAVVPEQYENMKSGLKNSLPPDVVISDMGEKSVNGINVLYLEGTSDSNVGGVDCLVYCMKRDAETCVVFTSVSKTGIEQSYQDAINTAMNSVLK